MADNKAKKGKTDTAPKAAEPETIGQATGLPDGAIALDLRAVGADGTFGEARIVVKPTDANYASIVSHVGKLAPGEVKPVRPFPKAGGVEPLDV
jgi:hypothetical protein